MNANYAIYINNIYGSFINDKLVVSSRDDIE